MRLHACLLLAALGAAACQTTAETQSSAPSVAEAPRPVDMRELQTALKKLGYYRGGVDGIAGPMTRAAAEQAQADFGLPVTGEPDGRLQQRAEDHLRHNAPHPNLPNARQVFALQRALARLGYYEGPNDGRYVGDTLTALLTYQRDKKLPITRKLDDRTLARIEREAAAV